MTNSNISETPLFAEVAIPAHVTQTYTYHVPKAFLPLAQRGCRVAVPFGRKMQIGYVVALHDTLEGELAPEALKDIEAWLDETPVISEEILELSQWVADYYYAPWGEVLKAALPTGLDTSLQTWVTATEAGRKLAVSRQQSAVSGQPEESHKSIPVETGMLFPESDDQNPKPNTQNPAKQLTKHKFLFWLVEIGGDSPLDAAPPEYSSNRAKAIARELEQNGLVKIQQRIGRQRVQPKRQTAVRWGSSQQSAVSSQQEEKNSAPSTQHPSLISHPSLQQQRVFEVMETVTEAIAFTELTTKADVSPSVIHTLEKKGVLEVFVREIRRDPLAYLKSLPDAESVTLNAGQAVAYEAILDAVAGGRFASFLLQGITGSGKTEVYLTAMQAVVERGQSALMLVPEIGLTPMFSRRLSQKFGALVAVLHSSLSPGERLDEWERIRDGQARVVIGTRSAIFAPLVDLGLIIIDEEHDGSYKQSESVPHYHARDTAIVRASRVGCPIVLGSATPAIESAQNAQAGKYVHLTLTERFGGRSLPDVTLVDMREVFKRHKRSQFISDELSTAIQETCSQREQVMILLNRRGFASFMLCRSCGLTSDCPNCDVTLTYHKADRRLSCHYCNHHTPVPENCPNCNGRYINYVGEGTEQLEERLRELFPHLKIARLDRDVTRRRGVFERVLGEFASGGIDILVGTQMIAKGHDFPNVTLVCVVSVDAGLAVPDFRSAERTFQLLAQVAGRAGRGDRPGRVLIQTYHPEHYALGAAREQDYERFFREEISYRRALYYPPFSVLANVVVRHTDLTQASGLADRFAQYLRGAAKAEPSTRILGPAPAPMSKLRGEYRFQILVKARKRQNIRDVFDLSFAKLTDAERRNVFVEIDPVDLM